MVLDIVWTVQVFWVCVVWCGGMSGVNWRASGGFVIQRVVGWIMIWSMDSPGEMPGCSYWLTSFEL